MRHHFELAQGSRRSIAALAVRDGEIDGRQKLGETLPTQLLGVDGYSKLCESQFIRLAFELGSECFPDLRGRQVQLLKELCLAANCSEEFFLSGSKDQWLRTAVICRSGNANALFSSELIEQECRSVISSITIHSNVVPRYPYWSKLQDVRDGAPDVARKRVYFPTTFLDLALSGDKSLAEKLDEWEEREEECAIVRQWHQRDEGEESDEHRAWTPFWNVGPDDVEVVKKKFEGGSQADVGKILWRGGIFARKVFQDKETFETELEVVRRVSHPHIVYSFGVSITDEDQQEQHSLLMELLDGDLFLRIKDRVRLVGRSTPPFSHLDSIHILLQVAQAMRYVHGLPEPVIHGDLKPQNILVSHCEILGDVCQYFIKVADFGSAKILKPTNGGSSNEISKSNGGTTEYTAPEVLRARSEMNLVIDCPQKIDVYSFGILAFQVLTGLEPYRGVTSRKVLKEGVIAGTLRPPLREACSRPKFWSDQPDLISLVESCWDPNPSARPFFFVPQVADPSQADPSLAHPSVATLSVADRLEIIYNGLIQVCYFGPVEVVDDFKICISDSRY